MVDNSDFNLLHVTEELQQHIDRDPPMLLCHYTNQHGLLGIISTGGIWATSVSDLNDKMEFKYAKEMTIALIARITEIETCEVRKRHLGYLASAAQNAGINICISSWSEKIDDLSQWRAYGGADTGYSVNFKGSLLNELAKKQDFILAACIYDKTDQENILYSLINKNLEKNIKNEEENPPKGGHEKFMLEQNGGDFAYHINRYASLFKHPGFKAESEWRLISKPLGAYQMDFRPGVSTVASHFKFSLRDIGEQLDKLSIQVESVHVGPCPEPELARSKVRFLLAKHCPPMHDPEVLLSAIPYRTW